MIDRRHMERALELARPHHTHSNPRVGAVIVDRNGTVVGEGAHRGRGHPHAEIVALDAAGELAAGATVYTTLEPCTVEGLTPPCVDALIAAGVSRVVVGAIDPDLRVAGSGVRALAAAGLDVIEGVLAEEVRAADPAYFHHRETGMPLVVVKYAMTLDGSAAATDRTSQWITGEEARTDAHRLRSEADAVVVGAGTLRTDDPQLSVRLPDFDGPQPTPVVVAGTEELPGSARIWEQNPLVVSTVHRAIPSGRLLLVDGHAGRPDPAATCRALVEHDLLAVMIEGGPVLAGEWWRAGVVSRGVAYVGAKVGGGVGISPLSGVFDTIETARVVSITGVRSLGDDIRIDFDCR